MAYSTDMWRGPLWVNMNYMVAAGLRDYGFSEHSAHILRNTIDEIALWYEHDGVIYEFYDSMGKTPPSRMCRKGQYEGPYIPEIKIGNIRDYGWSSALYVAMTHELNAVEQQLGQHIPSEASEK